MTARQARYDHKFAARSKACKRYMYSSEKRSGLATSRCKNVHGNWFESLLGAPQKLKRRSSVGSKEGSPIKDYKSMFDNSSLKRDDSSYEIDIEKLSLSQALDDHSPSRFNDLSVDSFKETSKQIHTRHSMSSNVDIEEKLRKLKF